MATQKVRLLIGTRKGAYIAESDTKRRKWTVRGPSHAGADVFHVVADPRQPGDVYAAVNSGFWGPMFMRSSNWGKTWKELAPPLMQLKKARKPIFDPTTEKFPLVNLWHIEPGPEDQPETIYLGVDPASLYRSDDRGASWQPNSGINDHATREKWGPGAGGLCLHSILLDPTNSRRMWIGISAAGVFRTDDGGAHWSPKNSGVLVDFLPVKNPEVGQCVHKIALDPANPNVVYRQDHNGIHVSRNAGDDWIRLGKKLPTDFGFVTSAPAAAPGTAFFAPLDGMSRTSNPLQILRWSEDDRKFTPTIKKALVDGELGTHREGMATDALDPFGLYLGTTTGHLLYTPDGTKSWSVLPYSFPGIHSVEVASPPNGR